MGTRPVNMEFVDANYNIIHPETVQFITSNRARAIFTTAQSGHVSITYGQGTSGTSGADGIDGGISLRYGFDTSTDMASNPGTGDIRFDNVDLTQATELVVSINDNAGTNVKTLLLDVDNSTNALKGYLTIFQKFYPERFVTYKYESAFADNTDRLNLDVSYVSGTAGTGTTFNISDALAGDDVIVTFSRVSDAGSAGSSGSSGSAGTSGSSGSAGSAGTTGSSGSAGTTGSSGASGADGPSGSAGSSG